MKKDPFNFWEFKEVSEVEEEQEVIIQEEDDDDDFQDA